MLERRGRRCRRRRLCCRFAEKHTRRAEPLLGLVGHTSARTTRVGCCLFCVSNPAPVVVLVVHHVQAACKKGLDAHA